MEQLARESLEDQNVMERPGNIKKSKEDFMNNFSKYERRARQSLTNFRKRKDEDNKVYVNLIIKQMKKNMQKLYKLMGERGYFLLPKSNKDDYLSRYNNLYAEINSVISQYKALIGRGKKKKSKKKTKKKYGGKKKKCGGKTKKKSRGKTKKKRSKK